jgi:hypothetical protein
LNQWRRDECGSAAVPTQLYHFRKMNIKIAQVWRPKGRMGKVL